MKQSILITIFAFLFSLSCSAGEETTVQDASDAADVPTEQNDSAPELQCPDGWTLCGTDCVKTDIDPANCGECGNACASSEECSSGECILSCDPGLINCEGTCVDLSGDENNCGECGNVCPSELHAEPACEAGDCSYYCLPGWSDMDSEPGCETECVFVSDDEICNGVDDNCNGLVDEGFQCPMGTLTTCITTCESIGTGICGLDCLLPSLEDCNPPIETCNGVDDDCDGECDNDFECCRGSSDSCETECGSTGTHACSALCTWNSCIPPSETCNGVDDDCDALCDEDFECCAGTTEGCRMPGGTIGEKRCLSLCTWGSCGMILEE